MYYFDELQEQQTFQTPARTITETDVVMFAALTGDYNAIHTDSESAKSTQYGQRLVHGLLALSISHGLMFRTAILDGSAIAFAEIDELKFLRPVFINDTLHGRITVQALYPSKSKLDRGMAYFGYELINQRGEVVQTCIKKLMMKKKPV